MKIKTTLFTAITLFIGLNSVFSQTKVSAVKPSADLNRKALKPVSTENYKSFVESIRPLLDKMSSKRVVGLGEGTHGTSEFYKLRYWITRELVEKRGFNHIAFENDFSDSKLLNQKLKNTADLVALMKKHLLSIWQNEETKELFDWVKSYNASHQRQVIIDGIDYVYLKPDLEVLKELLKNQPAFLNGVSELEKPVLFQDEMWEGMNNPAYKGDFKALNQSSYKGYLLADSLNQKIVRSELPAALKEDCLLALENLKQAFAPFYHEVNKTPDQELSRDENMARTTVMILSKPDDKMVIWAHNGHVAKTAIYEGAVGGTGAEILKRLPNQYFVLGTGTATGTFAATPQSRDTYTNPMAAYPLEAPIQGSWEELLAQNSSPVLYFDPVEFNTGKIIKPLRFIGYTPKSGPSTYDKTNLITHFDAFLFIRTSHAATALK